MEVKFEIEKHWELRALNKALFFLKFEQFNDDRNCQMVVGSPIIVDVYTRILKELEVYYRENGYLAEGEAIIGTELHAEHVEYVKKNLKYALKRSPDMKKEIKMEVLETLIAPFTVTDTVMKELMEIIEE